MQRLLIGILLISALMISMSSLCYAQSAGSEDPADIIIDFGATITLQANTANAAAWQWFKDGQPIDGAYDNKLKVSAPGDYSVIAYNSLSCASPRSDLVRIRMKSARADMEIRKNSEIKQVNPGDTYEYILEVHNKGPHTATNIQVEDQLPESIDFKRFSNLFSGKAQFDEATRKISWRLDSLQKDMTERLRFSVIPDRKGQVTNTAKVASTEPDPDMSNNLATDIKNILGLKIPNVITPNGDGKNDSFVIPGLVDFPDNEIVIINRWGNSVYQKHNYQNDWTGEGLNEGTYFYVLTVKNERGHTDSYKGYITLLRSQTH